MAKSKIPEKLEIFLLLALRQAAQFDSPEPEEAEQFERAFAAVAEQLPTAKAKQFEQIHADFENKSDEEKQKWCKQIEKSIGSDEFLIDETVHWSHIEAALEKENSLIQKIAVNAVSPVHQKHFKQNTANKPEEKASAREHLERNIRRTFIKQFIALRDLSDVSDFDRLNGAHLVRLIRLAGIREVAMACAEIEAVESVTAFLRRFAAEDARAIATHLRGLPKVSPERLSFAEDLVQTALKRDLQPSAMLDWLGMRLIGVVLCNAGEKKINYTEQKLPLEVKPKLSEMIDAQCRKTPGKLQSEISKGIDQLAETIWKQAAK